MKTKAVHIAAVQQDPVMRWLTVGVCVPLLIAGVWCLLAPRHYQQHLLHLSARLPDQQSVAPFVRFLSGKHFPLLLRLFSLLPIGLAVSLLTTIF
jgi:hypothetical protein